MVMPFYRMRVGKYEYLRIIGGENVSRIPVLFMPAYNRMYNAAVRYNWRTWLISAGFLYARNRNISKSDVPKLPDGSILFIDSGAFQFVDGKYPFTPREYLNIVLTISSLSNASITIFATMDVLPSSVELRRAQRDTVVNTLQIMYEAEKNGIDLSRMPLVAVVHGDTYEDFMEHYDMYRQSGIRIRYLAMGNLRKDEPKDNGAPKFREAVLRACIELKKRGVKWVHLFGPRKGVLEHSVCCADSFDTTTFFQPLVRHGRVYVFHDGRSTYLFSPYRSVSLDRKIEITVYNFIQYTQHLAKLRSQCSGKNIDTK